MGYWNCRLWKVQMPHLRCYISAYPPLFINEERNQLNDSTTAAKKERYGPTFAYDEFLVMRSKTSIFFFTMSWIIGMAMMRYVAPVSLLCNTQFCVFNSVQFRWIVKKFITKPGSGPSDELSRKKPCLHCCMSQLITGICKRAFSLPGT